GGPVGQQGRAEARGQVPFFLLRVPAHGRLEQVPVPVGEVRVAALPGADDVVNLPPLLGGRAAGRVEPGAAVPEAARVAPHAELRPEGGEGVVVRRVLRGGRGPRRREEGAAHGVFGVGEGFVPVAGGTALVGDVRDRRVHVAEGAGVGRPRVAGGRAGGRGGGAPEEGEVNPQGGRRRQPGRRQEEPLHAFTRGASRGGRASSGAAGVLGRHAP